ncbi:RNA-binding protein 26 isoform X2 [Plodia interpunctella]|uniref:RNA-binding protein 26 isoform X2 n=1 Tax=Plodia interpunctella TaxID=58824 RepID=UPI00236837F6|nr:RNA-binding protein 26 isoform X2 [Plodia interpunctella]
MIIENPDAFKTWLTSILEPLCDADPAALAKYVYALVKKDKPLDELRDGMVDQLDVFLQHETKPFVDMLFKSLEGNDYLKASEKPASPAPAQDDAAEAKADSENHPPANGPAANGPEEPRPPPRARPRSPAPRHRVVVRAVEAPRPEITRAPHTEQTLVKVLPLTELLEEAVDQPPRRRDRRADTLRDKDDRRRRRSRSWERRVRQRRHPREHDPRGRRPLSRSPSPRGRYRNRSPPALDRPTSRSRSRSPVPMRDREHERERDRLRVTREIERDRMSRDRDHRDRVTNSRDRERSRSASPADARLDHEAAFKRRCRDFDEKGYCMRGDLCQWDHGADPVVLEDAALTRVLAAPPQPQPPAVPEYNPLTPDIWGAFPFAPPPHAPRELIVIPRARHEAPPPAPRPPPPKKNFDYNRLGSARPPLPASAANCSLEVKKVPRGMNDITHLNNHFSKFGKIVNIQVCYEGDPEAALITFSNPTEANIAYKSTEAVLNNRFIKVFWHNPENKQDMSNQNKQHMNNNNNNNERNGQHPMSFNKVLINRTEQNTKVAEKQPDKSILQTKETANGQEPKKEAPKPMEKFKMITEMYKRAQALLDKQIQQQKLLIDKLEAGNVTPQQKSALLEAIQSSQEGIEKLNKEVKAYSKTLSQLQGESVSRTMSRLQLEQAKKPKTRAEAEKEILDAELDLFTKQQEGQDVTELLKRVAELRRLMAVNFPSIPASRKPYSSYRIVKRKLRGGRFTSRSYTRAPAPTQFLHSMNQSVDRRPRALLVSGFESDDLDALVAHFEQFGTITHKDVNLAVPELTLMFATRANAEHAAQAGKHYNDRTLSITWVLNPKIPVPNSAERPQNTNGDSTAHETKEAEQPRPATEDVLLDEEEDEDAEDRSWRR